MTQKTILICAARQGHFYWPYYVEHTDPDNVISVTHSGMTVFDELLTARQLVEDHLRFKVIPFEQPLLGIFWPEKEGDLSEGRSTTTSITPKPISQPKGEVYLQNFGDVERHGELCRVYLLVLENLTCHFRTKSSKLCHPMAPEQVFASEPPEVQAFLIERWQGLPI